MRSTWPRLFTCLLTLTALEACITTTSGAPAAEGSPFGGGGIGAEDQPGDDATAAAAVTPLSESSFVYLEEVRQNVFHIRAFDAKTRTSSLVTKLEDDGSSGTRVRSVALSPDRKWIAFTAHLRADDAATKDATGLPSEATWLVSVDGKVLRRVADPILPATSSRACTSDLDCAPDGLVCNGFQHCDTRRHVRELFVTSWSSDQKRLVLQYREHWLDKSGFAMGGFSVATVPVAGGIPMVAPEANASCQMAIGGGVRDGKLLVARTRDLMNPACKQGGVFLYDAGDPKGAGQALVVDQSSAAFEVELSTPRWLPDGSGFLFVAAEGSPRGRGLYVADLANKSFRRLASLPGGNPDTVAVSPSGRHVVLSVSHDLYVVTVADGKVDRLTTDGRSSHPSG